MQFRDVTSDVFKSSINRWCLLHPRELDRQTFTAGEPPMVAYFDKDRKLIARMLIGDVNVYQLSDEEFGEEKA